MENKELKKIEASLKTVAMLIASGADITDENSFGSRAADAGQLLYDYDAESCFHGCYSFVDESLRYAAHESYAWFRELADIRS